MGRNLIAQTVVDSCDGRRLTLDDRLDEDDATTLRLTSSGRHAVQVDVYIPANERTEVTVGHLWRCEAELGELPGATRDERLRLLARIVEDVSFAKPGRLWASVEYEDDDSQVAILRPISEKSVTEDAILDATADVAKTRRQIERAIEWTVALFATSN